MPRWTVGKCSWLHVTGLQRWKRLGAWNACWAKKSRESQGVIEAFPRRGFWGVTSEMLGGGETAAEGSGNSPAGTRTALPDPMTRKGVQFCIWQSGLNRYQRSIISACLPAPRFELAGESPWAAWEKTGSGLQQHGLEGWVCRRAAVSAQDKTAWPSLGTNPWLWPHSQALNIKSMNSLPQSLGVGVVVGNWIFTLQVKAETVITFNESLWMCKSHK